MPTSEDKIFMSMGLDYADDHHQYSDTTPPTVPNPKPRKKAKKNTSNGKNKKNLSATIKASPRSTSPSPTTTATIATHDRLNSCEDVTSVRVENVLPKKNLREEKVDMKQPASTNEANKCESAFEDKKSTSRKTKAKQKVLSTTIAEPDICAAVPFATDENHYRKMQRSVVPGAVSMGSNKKLQSVESSNSRSRQHGKNKVEEPKTMIFPATSRQAMTTAGQPAVVKRTGDRKKRGTTAATSPGAVAVEGAEEEKETVTTREEIHETSSRVSRISEKGVRHHKEKTARLRKAYRSARSLSKKYKQYFQRSKRQVNEPVSLLSAHGSVDAIEQEEKRSNARSYAEVLGIDAAEDPRGDSGDTGPSALTEKLQIAAPRRNRQRNMRPEDSAPPQSPLVSDDLAVPSENPVAMGHDIETGEDLEDIPLEAHLVEDTGLTEAERHQIEEETRQKLLGELGEVANAEVVVKDVENNSHRITMYTARLHCQGFQKLERLPEKSVGALDTDCY